MLAGLRVSPCQQDGLEAEPPRQRLRRLSSAVKRLLDKLKKRRNKSDPAMGKGAPREEAAKTSQTPSMLFFPRANAWFYHVNLLLAEELSAPNGNGLCDLLC